MGKFPNNDVSLLKAFEGSAQIIKATQIFKSLEGEGPSYLNLHTGSQKMHAHSEFGVFFDPRELSIVIYCRVPARRGSPSTDFKMVDSYISPWSKKTQEPGMSEG